MPRAWAKMWAWFITNYDFIVKIRSNMCTRKRDVFFLRLVLPVFWDFMYALYSIQTDVRAKARAKLIKINAWAKLIKNSNGGTARLINLLINSRYRVSSFVSLFDSSLTQSISWIAARLPLKTMFLSVHCAVMQFAHNVI